MEALILFLIGLASGLGVASIRHADKPVEPDTPIATMTPTCQPGPNSVWVANLEDPTAPRWVVQEAGGLCNPLSGERLEIEGLRYTERR